MSGDEGRGATPSSPTQLGAIRSRPEVGAGTNDSVPTLGDLVGGRAAFMLCGLHSRLGVRAAKKIVTSPVVEVKFMGWLGAEFPLESKSVAGVD